MHPVLAPQRKIADLDDRALMIHAHGDTCSDKPVKLGGGRLRMVYNVVKSYLQVARTVAGRREIRILIKAS